MKIAVEKIGNRIYLRSPWSAEMPARCKSVGGRWAAKSKAWTYPLDIETCRKLRDEFGDDLVIGSELTAWARAEVNRERELTSVGSMRDMDIMAEIDLPVIREMAPAMWEAMLNRPYQPVASLYMATAGQCLNADQPGVGKTIETLGALVQGQVSGRVLIGAPKTSCRVVWEPEIHRWLSDYKMGYTITRISGLSGKKLNAALAEYDKLCAGNPDSLNFLISNVEFARIVKDTHCPAGICDGDEDWCPEIKKHKNRSKPRCPWLYEHEWDAIVLDETHKWLINTRGKGASQNGYGLTKLRSTAANVRYALTGTPLKGKKVNLFGTLNWLRPKVYTSKWRWIGDHFIVEEDDWGHKVVKGMKEDTVSFFRRLGSIMIRRTKRELREVNPGWMPPEKRYHDIWVDMLPNQRKMYDQMQSMSYADIEGGRLKAKGSLAEYTRLKQFANAECSMVVNRETGEVRVSPLARSPKLEWLFDFLEERGIEPRSGRQKWGELSDEVQKVVVASQFTKIIDVYYRELRAKGIKCHMLTGKTADRDDIRHVAEFQDMGSDVRVFLINTWAGGVSITLDAADDIVVLDETWVPDDTEQVEDRVHRTSNVTHQVDVWFVRTRETVEEYIAQVNYDKAESNHVVLDERAGLEFLRRQVAGSGKKGKVKKR